jgi:hypothetical protein
MVDGDASSKQIRTTIFKNHRKRVELERISTLRRLWFESKGREAPPLENGNSSVADIRTRKRKAKKVASKRTRK